MTKDNATWLKYLALLALLPATMANKGGCSPDVDMGSDAETTGGATAGGASEVKDGSQGTATSVVTVGGAPGSVSGTADTIAAKGGAIGTADTIAAKGGAIGTADTVASKGGASGTADTIAAKGGAIGTADTVASKGGASGVVDQTTTKGGDGTEPYIKCTNKDGCGAQPKTDPCPNGNSPILDCVGTPEGQCTWKNNGCPASAMCSEEMCGTKPDFKPCEGDMPGGVTCQPNASGVCQWQQQCTDPPLCRPKCGAQPTERSTCPDGSLKALTCDFVGVKNEKWVPCSDLATIGSQWVEQPCLVSVSCDGVDEVIVLARYLTTSLDVSKYSKDPADAQALCKEAFRQPKMTQPNLSCITEKQGYGYELLFLDYHAPEGSLLLDAFVFPHGECDTMSTTESGAITVRTPQQSLWEQLNKYVGVNMQEM